MLRSVVADCVRRALGTRGARRVHLQRFAPAAAGPGFRERVDRILLLSCADAPPDAWSDYPALCTQRGFHVGQLRLEADSVAECERLLRSAMVELGPQVAVVAPGLAAFAALKYLESAPLRALLAVNPLPADCSALVAGQGLEAFAGGAALAADAATAPVNLEPDIVDMVFVAAPARDVEAEPSPRDTALALYEQLAPDGAEEDVVWTVGGGPWTDQCADASSPVGQAVAEWLEERD